MFCISIRDASGRNSHIFYVDVDSNPEVVLLRSYAELSSVLSCCLSCLEIRNFMHELHAHHAGDELNLSQRLLHCHVVVTIHIAHQGTRLRAS